MANLFCRHYINRLVLFTILGAFTLTYAIPVQAIPSISVNDVAFLYRIEKLVEKIWKLELSTNKNKMYEAIIDLKSEIESSCGKKIDLNKHMEIVEKTLRNKGYKSSKKEFDAIRNALKKMQKNHKKHKKYLASVMHLEGKVDQDHKDKKEKRK